LDQQHASAVARWPVADLVSSKRAPGPLCVDLHDILAGVPSVGPGAAGLSPCQRNASRGERAAAVASAGIAASAGPLARGRDLRSASRVRGIGGLDCGAEECPIHAICAGIDAVLFEVRAFGRDGGRRALGPRGLDLLWMLDLAVCCGAIQ